MRTCSRGSSRTPCSHASSTSRRSIRTRSWPSVMERSGSYAASYATASPRRGTPSYATGSALRRRLGGAVLKAVRALPVRPADASSKFEPVFGARTEPGDVGAVQHEDRSGRAGRERDHRPRRAEQDGRDRQREGPNDRGQRGVTKNEEDDDPDARTDAADDRRHAQERTARSRHHFPAAPPAQKQWTPMAEH